MSEEIIEIEANERKFVVCIVVLWRELEAGGGGGGHGN